MRGLFLQLRVPIEDDGEGGCGVGVNRDSVLQRLRLADAVPDALRPFL